MPTSGAPSVASKSPRTWTIGDVLKWVVDDFTARNVESPRLEADLMLAHALGCNRIQLIVDRDRPLSPGELAQVRMLVQRRRNHEPIAYLRGEREFYGLSFRVDRRVLVPRPDTETLVEVALERTSGCSMYGRLLDLCTGCGNVAIAFGKQRPTWKVDATDLSEEAVSVARENALRLGVLYNARFLPGDLFEPIRNGEPYDLITANPPYIASAEIEGLSADIRNHEPRTALDGGEDGLEVVRRLVSEAPSFLAPGGVLAVEVGCDQTEATAQELESAGFEAISTARDLGGRPRVVSGRHSTSASNTWNR